MQALAPELTDTIVAPATAPGAAAIAVVRLSGPRARAIVQVLAPARRPRRPRELTRAAIRDAGGALLDDGMVVEMAAPRSYTGEDMAEVHLHGAPAVVEALVQGCLAQGARLAAPGEFTQRAVLAGRLDLVQAEAVADLVAAESAPAAAAAARALRGEASARVGGWLHELEGVLAAWQARVDFPEEATTPATAAMEAAEDAALTAVEAAVAAWLAGADSARAGLPAVVLAGPPNAGKSTLLNAWADEERALVDAAAGTTRDVIEVGLLDAGQRWLAVDTAGQHAAAVGLEARGAQLGRRRAAGAALVLWLHPSDQPWQPPPPLGPAPLYVVGTKADLRPTAGTDVAAACAAAGLPFAGWLAVTAAGASTPARGPGGAAAGASTPARGSGGAADGAATSACGPHGAAALRRWAVATLRAAGAGGGVGLRPRQRAALQSAQAALRQVLAGRAAAVTCDVLAVELQAAAMALGGLLGRDVDAAVLDRLFAEFCIGK